MGSINRPRADGKETHWFTKSLEFVVKRLPKRTKVKSLKGQKEFNFERKTKS